ncbi:SDR family NAD(P)-dependent oxidoreductase [Dactylosporangium sp. NPDC000521]|uniref:SDR family NAD(P)-dependent oxidoreductase n=1 Tax=Dactylosporangium sp. NPDC000521 TaxID=3363975 RepID=UPI00369618E9
MIVTGAASGIGEAVVHRLIAEGAGVVALDLQPTVARDWPGPVEGRVGDVTSIDDLTSCIDAAVRRFGRLDGVVAAAGIAQAGSVGALTPDGWRRVIEVNLTSVYLLAHKVVPRFAEVGGGSFVAIASQVGQVGYPDNAGYCAAKAGVINLMRSIAIDYGARGVRANAVCPGPIDTPMTQVGFAQTGEDYSVVTARVPAGRMGRSEEVAAGCAYLLSDDAGYVNGTTLTIDGGYTAQ